MLAEHGEERTAEVGEKLFEIGDETYPFIAILEGEAAVLDAAGNEIVRHGASGFLGEMNLLSGQTVFLTAVVTEPMRYIAVEREELRKLLLEDAPLSDILLSAFVQRRELLQQRQGIGIEIVGPRDSAADPAAGRLRETPAAAVHLVRPGGERGGSAGAGGPGAVRDPAGAAARRRRAAGAERRRALAGTGDRLGAGRTRGGRPAGDRRRPGRARRRRLRRLGGTGHAGRREHRAGRAGREPRGGSRTTSASRPGSPAPS